MKIEITIKAGRNFMVRESFFSDPSEEEVNQATKELLAVANKLKGKVKKND